MEKLAPQYPADALAEALEGSESGFAAHRRKAERPRRQRALREAGQRCGKNRVARLMREGGLRPKQKRRFRPATTDSLHAHPSHWDEVPMVTVSAQKPVLSGRL